MSPVSRASWHARASAVVIAWLLAAAIVSLVHRQVPASGWLMVHLLMLGAVTNAILIWSRHFAVAVLHLPDDHRRVEASRLIVFNVGALVVVIGVVTDLPAVVGVGALVAASAITWHLVALLRSLKRALPSRFAMTVHAYVAATVLLLPGILFGYLMATADLDDTMHARLLVAHVSVNVLGWVGLPIFATLVTLWPTMLRIRMVPSAERQAKRALPLFITGVVVAAGGALVGLPFVAVAGVVVYLAGVVLTMRPMAEEMRQRPPESFAAWSTLAGTVWLTASVVWFGVLIARSGDLIDATSDANTLVAAVLVGGVLQVLLGAMSYLLPAMVGGGPSVVRFRNRRANRAYAARLVIVNGGLLLSVLPSPSAVRVTTSVLVLAGMLWTIGRIVSSMRTPARERIDADDVAPHPIGPGAYRAGLIGGVVALVVAVAVGVAVDPAAVGIATGGGLNASAVLPTGERTEVTVRTSGMRFLPDSVDVPAGNALTITVVNDSDDIHDLVLETGQRISRLRPGQQATLDVGVVGESIEGWCSVAGHRQMGMVFHINVIGEPVLASGTTPAPAATDAMTDMAGMNHGSHDLVDNGAASLSRSDIDLMADPGPGFRLRDPRLAPVGDDTVHRVRLVVTEVLTEVAPDTWQTRWTFGGQSPGPTLHGRVGDTFVVTLVNDGTIGHSIDFHAGALAPDGPMRTIQPGESLEYRFTAERAGIWMYHCSTMPMSMHIANGMFGAVVIEPPGLAPVDESFVFVQSESYLGPPEGTADADKIASGDYDLVSFNGYPFQYDRHPIEVGVGERIRVWVLDAGPNVPSSFHVVGSRFDTVYREGAYDLSDGSAPGSGGSQALGLFPAQGGFVELTLPEPGTYPFVTHIMSDAERGAHGLFKAVQR